MEKPEHAYAGGNVNGTVTLENNLLLMIGMELTLRPSHFILTCILSTLENRCSNKYCTQMFITALSNSQKVEKN